MGFSLKDIRALFASLFIFSGGAFTYFFISANLNRRKWENKLNDTDVKDTTRPTNEYYGINWGYRADAMIKDRIDTGDLFLLKFECKECLKTNAMIKCYVNDLINAEFQYDSAGFAFRTRKGVFVIFECFGEIKIMDYATFLSQPFLKEVSLRKLLTKENSKEIKAKDIFRLSKKFVEDLGFTDELDIEIKCKKYNSSEDLLTNYYRFIKIGEIDEDNKVLLPELDANYPLFFKNKSVEFGNKLVIRSKSNALIDE